jgi:hypothetical protein
VTDGPYAAITREKQIKGWTRAKKLALIRAEDWAMKDLAPPLSGWRAGQFSVTERRWRYREGSFSMLPRLWVTGGLLWA